MSDSAKGKKSKYRYTVHKVGRTYNIYCPRRSAYLPILEVYDLLQNPKVKCFTADGIDFTAHMLKRATK